MLAKNNLPADWKTELVSRYPHIPEHSLDRMRGVLAKKNIDEIAAAIWKDCLSSPDKNKKLPDVFFHIVASLVWYLGVWSGADRFAKRTKKDWTGIATALEQVRDDHEFFGFWGNENGRWVRDASGSRRWEGKPFSRREDFDVPILWHMDDELELAIEWYRVQAYQATNYKRTAKEERDNLSMLFGCCRAEKIKHWIKVVSPCMRLVHGPTWTEAYTKRRASDWGITRRLPPP